MGFEAFRKLSLGLLGLYVRYPFRLVRAAVAALPVCSWGVCNCGKRQLASGFQPSGLPGVEGVEQIRAIIPDQLWVDLVAAAHLGIGEKAIRRPQCLEQLPVDRQRVGRIDRLETVPLVDAFE